MISILVLILDAGELIKECQPYLMFVHYSSL
jgi:hypothetical protein